MPSSRPIHITGAQVLLPEGLTDTSVTIADGRIAALGGAAPQDADRIAAQGAILAPALVDIHGDAFERQLMPRPGVTIPVPAALMETDRQLAANGIATAYHALTLSWEPGLRSVAMGEAVVAALDSLAPRLTVENRVQLRWETFCPEALPLIERALAGQLAPAIAFNDHTTMALLDRRTPLQDRPFDHDPAFPVADMTTADFAARMKTRAQRSGMTNEEYVALLAGIWARRPQVPGLIAEVAHRGRAAGVPMLSHDDSQAETRAWYRAQGARISEFPMNLPTARAARAAGDFIVFGAPNAARGGSHLGSPGAADMVSMGLCDILASDYYYPAMLSAVVRMHADGMGDLASLWPLVSANPARALGLTDRGRIAPGLRADLVLVDWPSDAAGPPAVTLTLSRGQIAYRARV